MSLLAFGRKQDESVKDACNSEWRLKRDRQWVAVTNVAGRNTIRCEVKRFEATRDATPNKPGQS